MNRFTLNIFDQHSAELLIIKEGEEGDEHCAILFSCGVPIAVQLDMDGYQEIYRVELDVYATASKIYSALTKKWLYKDSLDDIETQPDKFFYDLLTLNIRDSQEENEPL